MNYTTEVIANNVEFLSPRNEGGQGFAQQSSQGFGQMDQSAPAQAPAGGFQDAPAAPTNDAPPADEGIPAGFQAIEDDDIPF